MAPWARFPWIAFRQMQPTTLPHPPTPSPPQADTLVEFLQDDAPNCMKLFPTEQCQREGGGPRFSNTLAQPNSDPNPPPGGRICFSLSQFAAGRPTGWLIRAALSLAPKLRTAHQQKQTRALWSFCKDSSSCRGTLGVCFPFLFAPLWSLVGMTDR